MNSASKKCWEKIVSKSAKTRFLYSHEYREQKMGRNTARNNFSRNTRIGRSKNVLNKIVTKKFENTFFIFTRVLYQKMRGKTRETIFTETHE